MALRLTLVFAAFIVICVIILWPRKRKRLRGSNSAGDGLAGMLDISNSHGDGHGGGDSGGGSGD